MPWGLGMAYVLQISVLGPRTFPHTGSKQDVRCLNVLLGAAQTFCLLSSPRLLSMAGGACLLSAPKRCTAGPNSCRMLHIECAAGPFQARKFVNQAGLHSRQLLPSLIKKCRQNL